LKRRSNASSGKVTEIEFRTLFVHGIDGEDAYVYRFPDSSDIFGQTNGQVRSPISMPSDYLVHAASWTFYAEVKGSEAKRRFPRGDIRDTQWRTANKVGLYGVPYIFFIKNKNTGDWYVVPAPYLLESKQASWSWDQDLMPFRWTPKCSPMSWSTLRLPGRNLTVPEFFRSQPFASIC
jgi:hypothetical protein